MWDLSSAGLFLLISKALGEFVVPNPIGRYNISLTIGPLTDYARDDPDSSVSASRTLMLSFFEPTLCASLEPVPYMPDKTAEFQGPFIEEILNSTLNVTPIFQQARLPVCTSQKRSCAPPTDDFPILLFSPGYSIPRLYYNFMASAIASQGFTVITMDHPGDADIITYPDGHTSINNDTVQSLENLLAQLHPRVTDVLFLVDQLSNATAMGKLLPHRRTRPFTANRIGIVGHSLGGVTAVIAAQQESRLQGVINWDGNMLELPSSTVSQPVLLMSKGLLFPTWNDMWPQLEGPKLWVDIANATHFTFSDGPTLIQAAGEDLAPYADLLGIIAPEEMARILVNYTASWMSNSFAAESEKSWQEVKELEFPEVSLVNEDNI